MDERQRKTKDPCPRCRLHRARCLCALIPRLETATRLSLIVHAKELKRTTNTGRLAVEALANSQMLVRGREDAPLGLHDLLGNDRYQPLLLFPAATAVDLTVDLVKSFAKPIHLIVPDGNWRQASKVHTRYPELIDIPRVILRLPARADARHLRAESTPFGMATLEAIAEALRVIEGAEVGAALAALYQEKLVRTLIGRGLQQGAGQDQTGHAKINN